MPPRRRKKTAPQADVCLDPESELLAEPVALDEASQRHSTNLSECLLELSRELGLPLTEEGTFNDSAPPFRCTAGDGEVDDARDGIDRLMRALPSQDHNDLWVRVLEVTEEFLNPECTSSGEDASVPQSVVAHSVKGVVLLLASFAQNALGPSNGALPAAFIDAASLCQEHILTADVQIQVQIFQTLERICAAGYEGCEQFYGAMVMYLLSRCAQPKVSAADVSELYRLKALMSELDWKHESIESLKLQVLSCTANSAFLLKTHGPDMVALFYTVCADFTEEVNATVKKQVPHVNLRTLKAYSTSLWKALNLAEDESKVQIEQCVQEWILLAIRGNRKNAEKARVMLEELHRHHLQAFERELLCRSYAPVLWRGLKVANYQVRENAARLLEPIFPLVSSELSVEAQELEMMKQLRFLRETLEDPHESVRRAGINAACFIMKTYWDILPTHEVAQLLATLKARVTHEKRSPTVRAAVAEGLSVILENAATHPTMEVVLPEMGSSLLHDRSAIVRAASVSLLQTIAQCRAISTQVVVPHEELYLSVVSEYALSHSEWAEKEVGANKSKSFGVTTEMVAQRMAQLMAPSLFSVSLSEQVSRCHSLLQRFPLALLALLSNAAEVVALPDRVKLAVALFQLGRKELQKALDTQAEADGKEPQVTLLRVSGHLLEGTPISSNRARRCRNRAQSDFPEELDQFVYAQISEEDVVPLLQDRSGCAEHLWVDLIFALSPLDPKRLPRVVDRVHSDLRAACRGELQISMRRLMAVMRAATGWDILSDAVEPMFARLEAAAMRISAGQSITKDIEGTLALADAFIRDSEVRRVLLPAKAEVCNEVVQKFTQAFCDVWLKGLGRSGTARRGSEYALLGAAAQRWPQILGIALRLAQHLQHKLPQSALRGSDPSADVYACPAAEIQAQISSALISTEVVACLQQLETAADKAAATERSAKRARTTSATCLPTDIDSILQIYERVLEAMSVSRYLRILELSGEQGAEDDCALERNLHETFWSWAEIADDLQPLEGTSRLAKAWVSSGYMFRQIMRTKISLSEVVLIARQLLARITETVPAEDDEMKRVLRMLLWKFNFNPDETEVEQIIWSILGQSETDCTDTGSSDRFQASDRLTACVKEELPKFWKLRSKFMPEAGMPPEPEHGEADADAESQKARDALFMIGGGEENSAPEAMRSDKPLPSPCRT
jgi:hypothetical protein